MNLRFIMMHCGYVESCQVSVLIFSCAPLGRESFPSYKEAITELALDMYAKYTADHQSTAKSCCKKTQSALPDAKLCASCGREINTCFDWEKFQSYIIDLHGANCDSWGDCEYAKDRDLVWWPFWTDAFIGTPKEEIVLIPENAEIILSIALIEAKPELGAIKDIAHGYHIADWEKFKANIQPT